MITKTELQSALGRIPFIHESEVETLCMYAQQAAGRIVEIGTGFGGSAVLWLLYAPEGVLITTIDAYIEDPNTHWRASSRDTFDTIGRAMEALAPGVRWGKRLTMICNLSHAAVRGWKAPIHTLYIDGDHSYGGVKQDFEDWFPHVVKGGVILLHDSRRLPDAPDPNVFARGWQGPTRLADELRADDRVRLREEVYSLTAWEVL